MPSEEKWYALTGRIANSASRDSQLPSERFSTRGTPHPVLSWLTSSLIRGTTNTSKKRDRDRLFHANKL